MGEISMSGVRSYDLAEFPEPTGREEVWRFSPRAALKPLLEDAASDAHLTWHATVPAGITVREISAQEARQRAASAPVDRISALAAAHSGGAMLLEVPVAAEHSEPVVIDLTGQGRIDLFFLGNINNAGNNRTAFDHGLDRNSILGETLL